ncbi:MAG: MlaD family protein [Candidatus Eremiobacteraeota bacterium]|nr:MlaD family protein [Candidatus Eremiobacteraeota bacterium]
MSKQAQVGAFALAALALLFAFFYVITDFGTRHSGYRIGVHFRSAAGLHSGAQVFFSGVSVGSVESIRLLPDTTVDVILAIKPHVGGQAVRIPSESRFLIQAPLTGDPSLLIVPPRPEPGEQPNIIGPGIRPIAEQPQGTNTATIADLVTEGQGQLKVLNGVLADVAKREPRLLDELQITLENTNALTASASSAVARLAARSNAIATELQSNLSVASGNIASMTGVLDRTVRGNSNRLNETLAQIQGTATALNSTMQIVASIANDPAFKGNVLATTTNIAEASAKLKKMATDMESITGDPKTQSRLRETIRNLDETSQRANSLLGALGGHLQSPGPRNGSTHQGKPGKGKPFSLVSANVRITGYSRERVGGGSPLLGPSRGPSSSLALRFFPSAPTQFLLGANSLGSGTTTFDLAAVRRVGHGLYFGGGILYSRLGVLGRYSRGGLGFSTKLYDVARPMLDLSTKLRVAPGIKVFVGERDILHAQRRNVYGVEFTGAPR